MAKTIRQGPREAKHTRLRNRMKAYNITASDLARRCCVSVTTIRTRLRGAAPWTSWEIWAVMNCLEIPDEEMHLYFPRDGVDSRDNRKTTMEDYLRTIKKTPISDAALYMLKEATHLILREAAGTGA